MGERWMVNKLERNAVVGLVAAGLCGFVVERVNAPTKDISRRFTVVASNARVAAEPDCHHAVVCGGLHDLQDIARSQQTWPTFDIRTAKHFNLPYGIWGYVTYRDDQGRIQVSSIRREIPKGTEVYQDAFGHIILARCGNEITDTPELGTPLLTTSEPEDIFPPVQATDPSEPIGETPITVAPPSDAPPTTGIPPSGPPSEPPCCGFGVPKQPPISVGEPSSLALLILGLPSVVLLWLGQKLIRRKESYLIL